MQAAPPPQSPGSENLKQLGTALHAYHDKFGHFPPAASYDLQGKPLLSWRVHLLPFLGEDKLYQEFHLNEPWDSDHNKKLLSRMPAVYRTPDYQLDDQYITYYQVFVSERQQPPAQQAPGSTTDKRARSPTSRTMRRARSASSATCGVPTWP
jgi:hypothetical protein